MTESDDRGYVEGTPAERMAMIWPMSYEVFALMGYDVDAPLRRDVARLIRRGEEAG